MKLTEMIENLTKLIDTNPEYGNLIVVTAKDEEGNGFDKVFFEPSLGCFTHNKTFITDKEELEEYNGIINAVCIN
jgi:hypothetical protein